MTEPAQDDIAVLELKALIEKVAFGTLDASFELHNKRITSATVYGKRRNKYAKDNYKATSDVIGRIKQSCDRKESTKLTFIVNVRNGFIDEVLLSSEIERKYT